MKFCKMCMNTSVMPHPLYGGNPYPTLADIYLAIKYEIRFILNFVFVGEDGVGFSMQQIKILAVTNYQLNVKRFIVIVLQSNKISFSERHF